jgi:hypothetical protein
MVRGEKAGKTAEDMPPPRLVPATRTSTTGTIETSVQIVGFALTSISGEIVPPANLTKVPQELQRG